MPSFVVLLLLAFLAAIALFLQSLSVISRLKAVQQRRISYKFNLIVLNRSVADCCICLLVFLYTIILSKEEESPRHLPKWTKWTFDALLISSLCSCQQFLLLRMLGLKWPFRFRRKFCAFHAVWLNIFSWFLCLLLISIPFLLNLSPLKIMNNNERSQILDGFDAFKCLVILALHLTVFGLFLLNVLLVYGNWQLAKQFYNNPTAGRSRIMNKCNNARPQNLSINANGTTKNDDGMSTKSLSSELTISNQLERTPSIVDRRHRFSIWKSSLNLLALALFHAPFAIWLLRRRRMISFKFLSIGPIWIDLAIGGVLLRIAMDGLLDIQCDIELRKCFHQIANKFCSSFGLNCAGHQFYSTSSIPDEVGQNYNWRRLLNGESTIMLASRGNDGKKGKHDALNKNNENIHSFYKTSLRNSPCCIFENDLI